MEEGAISVLGRSNSIALFRGSHFLIVVPVSVLPAALSLIMQFPDYERNLSPSQSSSDHMEAASARRVERSSSSSPSSSSSSSKYRVSSRRKPLKKRPVREATHPKNRSGESNIPPPPPLRRMVASCWNYHVSEGKPNWLEITKLPPSSGPYIYDERYDKKATKTYQKKATKTHYSPPTSEIMPPPSSRVTLLAAPSAPTSAGLSAAGGGSHGNQQDFSLFSMTLLDSLLKGEPHMAVSGNSLHSFLDSCPTSVTPSSSPYRVPMKDAGMFQDGVKKTNTSSPPMLPDYMGYESVDNATKKRVTPTHSPESQSKARRIELLPRANQQPRDVDVTFALFSSMKPGTKKPHFRDTSAHHTSGP
jgi:hypothetical protein